MNKGPKIGVGVIVKKDNKVLVGKRKGAHGGGTWSFPGGHLEWNESIEECAIREVKEETGLDISDIAMGIFTNDIFPDEGKHYVTLYAVAEYNDGKPKVLEPDRCEEWRWVEWDNLPKPLFVPLNNLLKQKYNPFS